MHCVEIQNGGKDGGASSCQVALNIEPAMYGATIRAETGRSRGRRAGAVFAGLAAAALLICIISEIAVPQVGETQLLGDAPDMTLASAIKSFSEKKHLSDPVSKIKGQTTSSLAAKSPPTAAPEEAYDVTIPVGVAPGQTFLVDVPGRRDRDVTAPAGTKPGEMVSIDLPEDATPSAAQHSPHSQSLQDAAIIEPAEGGAASGAPAMSPEVSSDAESAGAAAVQHVQSYFSSQRELNERWQPGATQDIPKLQRLRYNPNFSPSAAQSVGAPPSTWVPGQPHAIQRRAEEASQSAQNWHHFRIVDKGKEQYEMSKPTYHPPALADRVPYKVPNLNPFHTAAFSAPTFTNGPPPSESPAQMPGFIVASTDDATDHAPSHPPAPPPPPPPPPPAPQPAAASQIEVHVQQGEADPTAMEEVPVGSNGGVIFPIPMSVTPSNEVQLQPTVSAPAQVTVTVHHPAPPSPPAAPPAKREEPLPELQKIPELPPLKFFSSPGASSSGKFRHWDGKTLQVLNVVPESGGAIDLNPSNWYMPQPAASPRYQPGANGFAPPAEQMREGVEAASQAQNHFVGADRSRVAYQTFGEVAPAAGEQPAQEVGAQ